MSCSTTYSGSREYLDAVETFDILTDFSSGNEAVSYTTPPTSPKCVETAGVGSHFAVSAVDDDKTSCCRSTTDDLENGSSNGGAGNRAVSKVAVLESEELCSLSCRGVSGICACYNGDNLVITSPVPADISSETSDLSVVESNCSHRKHASLASILSEEEANSVDITSNNQSCLACNHHLLNLTSDTLKRSDSLPSNLLCLSRSGVEVDPALIGDLAIDADRETARDVVDVCGDLHLPPPKLTPKSLAKSSKRSSDRKRKGSSWYSVLSPTYKSRSEDFRKIFKDVPDTERLIVDYSCALQKDILVHGRLYISHESVCFYANIFRWETVLTIRCKDIVKITKKKTARVIPNAIQICTRDDRYFFTSFGTRDKTFMMLERVWKNGINDQLMSPQELWQWVHYSYGEDLGLTSDDDADYVPLSAVDKIQFQMRVQREEKLAQQTNESGVSAPADITSGKTELEPVDDDVIKSSDAEVLDCQTSLASPSGSSVNTSAAVADTPEIWFSAATTSPVNSKCRLRVTSTSGIGVEPSDVDESTDDEEPERLCSEHDHFSIAVVDEILNIPVDTVFEYCFTDCPLYRDFVTTMKTFDVILSPWPDEADTSGVKVRHIAYTLSLNYTIGPKSSPSTERQILHPESKPGRFYLVDTECVNGGIPYGENFYIVNRFCIARVSTSKCRLRITSQIKYRKNVWGIVKTFIEKNASAGIIDSFSVMAELLREESNRQMQLALSTPSGSSLARKKVLRKRRPSDRSIAKRPSVDPSSSKPVSPVRRATFKASAAAKSSDEWHIKLTADVLIRIVCVVLVILLLFNAALLYKLWSLESNATLQMLTFTQLYHSQHSSGSFYEASAKNVDSPLTSEEWAQLLDHQQRLHDSEVDRWKSILANTIQLMDHMVHTLSDLQNSVNYASRTPQPDTSQSTASDYQDGDA